MEGLALALWLSSARREVTKDITANADEDNDVPGRIATAPLDLSVGHCDPRTSFNMLCPAKWFIVACVSDNGDVLISLHLIAVGPITVCLSAAGQNRIVRLQPIEPLAM